jgi:hypothetical protein
MANGTAQSLAGPGNLQLLNGDSRKEPDDVSGQQPRSVLGCTGNARRRINHLTGQKRHRPQVDIRFIDTALDRVHRKEGEPASVAHDIPQAFILQRAKGINGASNTGTVLLALSISQLSVRTIANDSRARDR